MNISNNEREYLLRSLTKGVRLDGREIGECRPTVLSFGFPLGYAECAQGDTQVACQVSARIGEPKQDRPFEGTITVNAEFLPLAGIEHELYRKSEEEEAVVRLLEKTIKSSGAIDQETLCIIAGESVWNIKVDIHFLNDAGNTVDCASVAAMAALLHFRRPDVSVSDKQITVYPLEERVGIPLAISHSPVITTFALYTDISDGVSDPTQLEELCSSGSFSVAMNAQRELTLVNKAGGAPVDVDSVLRLIKRAEQRTADLDAYIRKQVAQDLDTKRIEVR